MPRKTETEELEEARALIKKQAKALQQKTVELEKLKTTNKKNRLIPRPQGQAGRSKQGYNLQEEMRLGHDSIRYQRLLRIVLSYCNWYLRTGKTLNKQDKTRVEKLIELIQKEIAYFRLFQDAWPIRAMIKQYLRNAGDKLRRDLRKERAVEKDDVDNPEAPSLNHGTQLVDEDDDMEEDQDNTIWLDDDEDEDVEDAERGAPAQNADAEKEQLDLEDPLAFDEDFSGESERTPLRAASWAENLTPKKQNRADKENVSVVKQNVIKKMKGGRQVIPDSPINSPSPTKRKREDVAAKLDPVTPAATLTSISIPDLNREVCVALKNEHKKIKLHREAQLNQWPVEIDFEDLRVRCQAPELQDQIVGTAIDKETLGNTSIWQTFLKNIGYKIHAFALAEVGTFSVDADRAARCGYFGPKGQSIIATAVESAIEGVTRNQTHGTIVAALRDSPEQLDASPHNATLPSQAHFTHYILVPLVAASFISEDFEVDLDAAFKIMHESSDFGDVFNPNSIPAVDPRKIASNPRLSLSFLGPLKNRRSKEPKKAAEGKEATPKAPPASVKTTMMMSFPAPIIAKKKSTQQPKKPPQSPKLHVYSTRSTKKALIFLRTTLEIHV
ncbi:hypothetical protein K438DRAFT_2016530 [Mycena galopus ATCC 62051]|nr:hypothetical protein K438DRAFT_2016530 [Mycena galopus ATCC 62051]